MIDSVGAETANELKEKSLHVYEKGRDYAAKRGIILADTKFEWGSHNGELILIDEVLTPCLLYTSPSPRDRQKSRMPSSA